MTPDAPDTPKSPTTTAAPATARISSAATRSAVRTGLAVAAAFAALFVVRYVVVQVPPEPDPFVPSDLAFVRPYDPPRTKVATMLIVGDGQAWATLAQDPTFSDPAQFYDGSVEFVYRAQRPALPLLVWATSFGQPPLVPWALFLWSCVGVGAMVAAALLVAAQERRSATGLGIVVALFPGSITTVLMLGPEPLATALCALGLVWWRGPPRRVAAAVACFCGAVLLRDISIVVPAVLALHELLTRTRRLVGILPLAAVPVTFLAWVVSLKARYGSWPSEAGQLERIAPPLRGLIQAVPDYDAFQWVSLLLGFGLVVFAVRRSPRAVVTHIAIGFAVVSLVLGQNVWVTEFYRVLLPMYVFGLLGSMPRLDPSTRPKMATAP